VPNEEPSVSVIIRRIEPGAPKAPKLLSDGSEFEGDDSE